MASKTRVVLLFGGRSAEHEVSLVSAAAVYNHLDPNAYAVSSIYINREGKWRFVPSPLLGPEELGKGAFYPFLPWKGGYAGPEVEADIYFPVLHGPFGEDGTIQGLLEMAGVPYVGAAVLASAVGMDKATAKALFRERGLPVPPYLVLEEHRWASDPSEETRRVLEEISLPAFVKPSNLGSSVGISKVNSAGEMADALRTAFRFDDRVLVEEGIHGREIECSVLGNTAPRASLPGEIFPHREFYDYRDKYVEGKTRFGIPADLPEDTTREIQRLAVEAFQTIHCSGMARVDFFLQDRTGKILLSEVNTIPGFTEISMYPKLWEVSGLPFSDLLDELIRLGMERHGKRKGKGGFVPP